MEIVGPRFNDVNGVNDCKVATLCGKGAMVNAMLLYFLCLLQNN